MAAVTPLLHEIVPHGWSRLALLAPDATITSSFEENPAMGPLFRERLWHFMNDPSALVSLWAPAFKASAIGWSLHKQGPSYLESAYFREVEAPLDSCWVLSAMIGDGSRTIAHVGLTRPRRARRFTVEDVNSLDRLRPWLAHAFDTDKRPTSHPTAFTVPGNSTLMRGELLFSPKGNLLHCTPSTDFLLRILTGEPGIYIRFAPFSEKMPVPIKDLLRQMIRHTNGELTEPPRKQFSTPHGVLALEAKWLLPVGVPPIDAANNVDDCLIAIGLELREHAVAYAARVLRARGITPAQTKVAIALALGKSKSTIATELDLRLSSVADLTKKLYQNLEVHSSAELAARIWLDETPIGGWES